MLTQVRNLVGGLVLGTAVLVSPAVPASAAPDAQVQISDGLVNVQLGNVTIARNVNVQAAVQVVAQVCDTLDINTISANVLSAFTAVDSTGGSRTVCTTSTGQDVTLTQNTGPGRPRPNR
jgi:hypothetical protein